ncbi:MAG: hypothetical protein QXO40_02965 [Candidatus Aenigmatarchaeota archaeon]
MKIDLVICKSSHGTHQRDALYKELCNADYFVPEFFCSSILEKKLDANNPLYKTYIPAIRIIEAYEKAKAVNKKLKIINDIEAEKFFLSQFERIDELESDARKILYEMAYIIPLTSGYNGYKTEQKTLLAKIKAYAESLIALEDKFCDILIEKLKEIQREKKKRKIVIDSGYIHQYHKLKNINALEKALNANISLEEKVEKAMLKGFFEELVIDYMQGKLKEENLEEYSEKIAKAVLFEAIYSPYSFEIHPFPGIIDREKQEAIYKQYSPKVQKWGEKELKKFWHAYQSLILESPLNPYSNSEDMEKILKRAGLD